MDGRGLEPQYVGAEYYDLRRTRRPVFLVQDDTPYHRATAVKAFPAQHFEHLTVTQLPGYSPDFNPIERLWLRLKVDWFWDFFARTSEELTQRLCAALKSFMDQPSKTASICTIRK